MRSISFERRATASRAAIVALSLGAVGAQAVTLSPVLVDLSSARRIVSITISNPGDTAISYQAQTLAWSQLGGIDQFAESDALLVAPAIATIPAGGSQIFRVATRLPAGGSERAYRLVFEDVSEVIKPPGQQMTVTIRLSHNLPVFVAAAGAMAAVPKMTACGKSASAGMGCVRIENRGGRYLQVSGLSFGEAGSRQQVALSGRVLAGAWKQFEYPLPGNVSALSKLQVASSAGQIVMSTPDAR